MATPVDILLRLIGESRDAVQAFDQTTQAARRTERAVEDANRAAVRGRENFRNAAGGVQDVLSQAGYGELGAVAGTIASGAGIATIIGVAVTGLITAINKAAQEGFKKAVAQFDQAKDADELQKAYEGVVDETLFRQTGSTFEKLIGKDLPGIPGTEIFRNTKPTAEQRALANKKAAAAVVASDPALAALLVDQGGDEGAAIQQELLRVQAVQAFQKAAKEAYKPTNVTINTVTAHLNDGESLRAMLERANRNNGYDTTITKP